MNSICEGWITVNTDAGFYPWDKAGSYAYWIKGCGVAFKGSGLFKKPCASALDAESKAVINALHVVSKCGDIGLKKIILNTDAKLVSAKPEGHPNAVATWKLLKKIRKKNNFKKPLEEFFEFRYVKAHNGTPDKRSWVNDWCDKQCKEQLKLWNKQQREKKTGTK